MCVMMSLVLGAAKAGRLDRMRSHLEGCGNTPHKPRGGFFGPFSGAESEVRHLAHDPRQPHNASA